MSDFTLWIYPMNKNVQQITVFTIEQDILHKFTLKIIGIEEFILDYIHYYELIDKECFNFLLVNMITVVNI